MRYENSRSITVIYLILILFVFLVRAAGATRTDHGCLIDNGWCNALPTSANPEKVWQGIAIAAMSGIFNR